MKLNRIFRFLVVALCATTNVIIARQQGVGNITLAQKESASRGLLGGTAPASRGLLNTASTSATTETTSKTDLVNKIFANVMTAAQLDEEVKGAVKTILATEPVQKLIAPTSTDKSTVLGRLGANPEYDECCKKCATKHKKASKKSAKPAKKHTKEHAKKN